ncbi:MAG: XRE family transcriptional regulator [Prevotella sp.]|jgi:phage repressor protein C with HTH and peptisase S24 domain|nr:XRE family transcriptional regulator [Prevotella sp.]
MNNNWERLEKVIRNTGLSTNAFAISIGLKRSENLYRIKNGKNSISKDLAELITTKYCKISKSWLLTGEGSMYLDYQSQQGDKGSNNTKKIPYYDSIMFDSKNESINLSTPLYYIDVPTLSNCDLAVLFVGDSMLPQIQSGSIVALKETDTSLILPGEIYMIVTDNFTTIKYIRTIEGNSHQLRLVPANKESYDEFLLNKKLIRHLFLVKGVISTKVL